VQNARRRADEEVSKARKFALESFADSLLPVVDSLEAGLAVQTATPEQNSRRCRGHAAPARRVLWSANKVIAINPAAGTKFDPAQHQAISVVPAEQEANTVVAVLQKGYLIAERVLRPALVTVSAPE
jgi:molecular chaperone GrpE